MKFKVHRTFGDEITDTEQVIQEKDYITKSWFMTEEEWFNRTEEEFKSKGINHIVTDRGISRDEEVTINVIYLNTLEELCSFIKSLDPSRIVMEQVDDEEITIEIYDDYRE